MNKHSLFSDLEQLPMDPIFAVNKAYIADTRTEKVNLGIGIYRDVDGTPFVFDSVTRTAKSLSFDNFEYLSMQGNLVFLQKSLSLMLGENWLEKTALQQSLGGTHALKLVADFIEKNEVSDQKILVGNPTWGNHFDVFKNYKSVTFDHLVNTGGDLVELEVNISGYLENIKNNPNSVLILHGGSTHNPTGINFSQNDLEKIIEACNENNIFVVLDAAYIGFGDGFEADCDWIKSVYSQLQKTALCVSFSKNAALYNQRLGLLGIKTTDSQEKAAVESHLQAQVRASISNLPDFGASVMNLVLSDESLCETWKQDLESARLDINSRRDQLVKTMPEKFSFLQKTAGLFGMTGLGLDQIEYLKTEHGVYMPPNGRINFAGIRSQDFSVLAKAFSDL